MKDEMLECFFCDAQFPSVENGDRDHPTCRRCQAEFRKFSERRHAELMECICEIAQSSGELFERIGRRRRPVDGE